MSEFRNNRRQGGSNDYYNRVLHEGFEEDYKDFLNLFCTKNSYKYSTFAEIWNESHFNLIYGGRETAAIVEEFTEEIAHIVLEYVLSQNSSLLEKVCSIYMLYALYNKQPCGIKPSVRIVQKDVPILKGLKDQLKGPEFVHVQYVLCVLLREGFFRFVVTEFPYGLEKTYRKCIVKRQRHSDELTVAFSITQELNDILENNDIGLDACEKIFDDYNKAKTELPGSKNGVPSASLQLVNMNIIKSLKESASQMTGGENKFMGNKEMILRRNKLQKEPSNSLLVPTHTENYAQPSTSKRRKYERMTQHRQILKDYCPIHKDSSDNDSDNETKSQIGDDVKDMPTVEND